MDDAEARYLEVLDRARRDPNVIGVILSGSRVVESFVTALSDFDCYVILRDADPTSWAYDRGSGVDTVSASVEEFRRHATVGTSTFWNRPSFLYARVELDDTHGTVAGLLAPKRRLSPDEADVLVREALDDYINALYRSLKNLRDRRRFAGRLDALESIGPLLTTAFALDGRVRPFNKWLLYDLAREPVSIPDFGSRVALLADDPRASPQRAIFRDVEALARSRGYGGIIDAWQPDVPFLRGPAHSPAHATPGAARAQRQ